MDLIYYFSAIVISISPYWVAAEQHSQFFYTAPQFPQPSPYYSSSHAFPGLPYPYQATPFSSFRPSQQFYTHQAFGGYQRQVAPFGIQREQAQANVEVYTARTANEYRGFAYHTQTTNGASSNVFFVTGPDALNFRKLHEQNSISNIKDQIKTLASNAVDSNATDKKQEEQITEILTPQAKVELGPFLFNNNSEVQFQHIYSSNDYLGQNLPASTFLLRNPVSFQTFGNSAGLASLASRFAEIQNGTNSNVKNGIDEHTVDSTINNIQVKTKSSTNTSDKTVSTTKKTEQDVETITVAKSSETTTTESKTTSSSTDK